MDETTTTTISGGGKPGHSARVKIYSKSLYNEFLAEEMEDGDNTVSTNRRSRAENLHTSDNGSRSAAVSVKIRQKIGWANI